MKTALARVIICITMVVMIFPTYGQSTKRRAGYRPSGGIVEKPYSGNFFQIVNAQQDVSDDVIREFAFQMRLETLLAIQSKSENAMSFLEARKRVDTILKEPRIGATVIIVDDPSRDAYIESAEDRWAILNIAPLKIDTPEQSMLKVRLHKLLWRAVARALSVGYSNQHISVLMPFSTLADLDAKKSVRPAPDGINAMMNNAAGYGMTPLTIASYRTACRYGWAPAPTNDVQKAIWNEIHQIPDKPITIKYDPKRDK